jgi:DNA (cytosine-5)-methyltransferase 1
MVISAIELFSGTGMLGEGLRAGLAHLGITYRTVCHVEREAHAASVLVARMEEGSMDAAPIWSDVCTFPAEQFRGKVDFIVAGFPCQDISVAGQRKGLDGARSGLFFEIPKIADACGAWGMLLENVAGISSATATVVDEEEGELEERAAARVVGELADLGWDAEWIIVSAEDVGASHGRARWFCLAWRMDDAECAEWRQARSTRTCRQQGNDSRRSEKNCRTGIAEQVLGDTGLQYCDIQQWKDGAEYSGAGDTMEHTESLGNGSRCLSIGNEASIPFIAGGGSSLADSRSTGQQGSEFGRACNGNRWGQETHGSVSELCGLFAPGPSDPRWGEILERFPEVAPALEPTFRSVVNGLAFDMGDSRAARLKCVGNGVVALSAAAAVVILARRAGIFR